MLHSIEWIFSGGYANSTLCGVVINDVPKHEINSRSGFHVGVSMIDLNYENMFFFEPGARFFVKGFDIDWKDPQPFYYDELGNRVDLRDDKKVLPYIDVYLKVKPTILKSLSNLDFYPYIGTGFNYNMNTSEKFNTKYKEIDVPLTMGLDFLFSETVTMGFEYNHGLCNVIERGYGRNRSFIFNLGVVF
jgi:hypothetical protein